MFITKNRFDKCSTEWETVRQKGIQKFVWLQVQENNILFYLEHVRVQKMFGSFLKLKKSWTWVWLIESQNVKLIILASLPCLRVKILKPFAYSQIVFVWLDEIQKARPLAVQYFKTFQFIIFWPSTLTSLFVHINGFTVYYFNGEAHLRLKAPLLSSNRDANGRLVWLKAVDFLPIFKGAFDHHPQCTLSKGPLQF